MANCSYFTLVIGVIHPVTTGRGLTLWDSLPFHHLNSRCKKKVAIFSAHPSIHPSIHHAQVDLHVNFGRAPGYQAPSWGHNYIIQTMYLLVGGKYTLQGTNTYPTKREVRKIIDSKNAIFGGYVSFLEGNDVIWFDFFKMLISSKCYLSKNRYKQYTTYPTKNTHLHQDLMSSMGSFYPETNNKLAPKDWCLEDDPFILETSLFSGANC